MALTRTQALVTVRVPFLNLQHAAQALHHALQPYRDARIITLVEKTNWWDGFGATTLLAVIEYTPADVHPDEQPH